MVFICLFLSFFFTWIQFFLNLVDTDSIPKMSLTMWPMHALTTVIIKTLFWSRPRLWWLSQGVYGAQFSDLDNIETIFYHPPSPPPFFFVVALNIKQICAPHCGLRNGTVQNWLLWSWRAGCSSNASRQVPQTAPASCWWSGLICPFWIL